LFQVLSLSRGKRAIVGDGSKNTSASVSPRKPGLPDFSLVEYTKTGKNIPNDHNTAYQMALNYTKCPNYSSNDH
jgi:hypothetical protein